MYTAYVLTEKSRSYLVQNINYRFEKLVAHHITHTSVDSEHSPDPGLVEVVGYASDDKIEILVISIDGSVVSPSGDLYYLIYSLIPDRVNSDDGTRLAERGYYMFDEQNRIPLEVTTALLYPSEYDFANCREMKYDGISKY